MRAVIDTNILVRARIRPQGTVAPVLGRLRVSAYTFLYCQRLLDELVDVLGRPRIRQKYHIEDEDVTALLLLLTRQGEAIAATRRITVCRDPKDDKFLEVAVAGGADVIVSGDEDLLVLSPFEGIPIVGPSTFLAMLDEAGQIGRGDA